MYRSRKGVRGEKKKKKKKEKINEKGTEENRALLFGQKSEDESRSRGEKAVFAAACKGRASLFMPSIRVRIHL